MPKRSNRDKVIDSLRDSKHPLTFTEILYSTELKSTGNLHEILRNLMIDKKIENNVGLYNLL